MSIRHELADALQLMVPEGWKVYPHGQLPQNPRKPFLHVSSQAVRQTAGAPRLYRDEDYYLNVIVPETDPIKVEDSLDDAAELVCDLLDSIDFPGLVWVEGERAVFDEKFHGYRFTLTITTEKDA